MHGNILTYEGKHTKLQYIKYYIRHSIHDIVSHKRNKY